jgi:hypothetical protein
MWRRTDGIRAVGGVDLVVDVVDFHEEDVLVDTAGADVTFMAVQGRRGTGWTCATSSPHS